MRSFERPHPITITVDLALGDLRVTASDRADTVVTVQPTNPSKAADVTAPNDTRVEYADGRLAINTPKSWRRLSPVENGGSVQVTIDVPAGSSLEGSSSLGDLQVDGELDRCRVTDRAEARLRSAADL